jgi:hypothetical protein
VHHNRCTRPLYFRGGVHAEGNLVTVARVDQDAHAIAGASDGVVHLHTLGVASASLHIAVQKMAVDRVKDDLRNLRDVVVVVEQEKGGLLTERAKQRPDGKATGRDAPSC